MSSEKKHAEALKAVRSVFDGIPAPCAERDALDFAIALLARTEAGADGAAMAALERESDKSMGVGFNQWFANPYTAVLLKSIAEDYVPRTHPQDASGDAERYRVLRRALADPMFTSDALADAISGRNAKAIDAVVDAMQAKEAK